MSLDFNELESGIEAVELDNSSFEDLSNEFYIGLDELLEKQPIAISCGSYHMNGKTHHIPIASYGDFFCVSGQSKSKKTFVVSMIVACYIGGNSNLYCDFIKGHDIEGKHVVWIDTEQSKYHAQRSMRRVAEMVGVNPDNFHGYGLRSKSPKERLKIIDKLFNDSKIKDNLGLVIIDGVADLVMDINNIEESTYISGKLLEWTANSLASMGVVIHENPGIGGKMKGHLGTFLTQKCETNIRVEKINSEASKVSAGFSRNKAFEDFAIEINGFLPYATHDIESFEEEAKPSKINGLAPF